MPNRGVVLPRHKLGPRHFTIYEDFNGKAENNCKFSGYGYIWNDHIFIDLFMAEIDLRMTVQQEERLKIQHFTIQKAIHSGEDSDINLQKLDKLEALLKDLDERYNELIKDLHYREMNLFKIPLKEMYDAVRQNPTWYMRKELVASCAASGGCCSRRCGCCRKRQSTSHRVQSIGHCTVECECCTESRGTSSNFTQEERAPERQRFEKMLRDWKNPAFLLNIIESNFLKPKWDLGSLRRNL